MKTEMPIIPRAESKLQVYTRALHLAKTNEADDDGSVCVHVSSVLVCGETSHSPLDLNSQLASLGATTLEARGCS